MGNAETIQAILSHRRIAVVGASDKPDRPSYQIVRYLLDQGYEVIPVNPALQTVLGQLCYPSLQSIPGPVDVVDVFRRPEHVPEVVDDAIAKGAKALWLQLGITHPQAEAKAQAAGLQVVSDQCIMVAHQALARQGLIKRPE